MHPQILARAAIAPLLCPAGSAHIGSSILERACMVYRMGAHHVPCTDHDHVRTYRSIKWHFGYFWQRVDLDYDSIMDWYTVYKLAWTS
jgi:hypothetical protein